ncbi:ATP:cob(I)alamin adenosyltransferase [Chthonomonas calidirosea]|uniref:cob(I)yrinic acid a,c-diamide adenosyltransferase n=1 Tax=Chthonomonas calidirosea TaxID=454171 RepID=UPI0006DD4640|nr:cob(I)yrinic acid a,c-diamide adenosyltransferase [Chthonomonas calidirosea]CEK17637.1 ATP:cob(I)alamin adenosyltransferase [Chthonomonas calidirosea]
MSLRIYTRTGDSGQTGLFGGTRVDKDDLRVEAYGAVDELNAAIGLACAQWNDSEIVPLLQELQGLLLVLGGDLATPGTEATTRGRVQIERIKPQEVEYLERLIDRFEEQLPPLNTFILPGGSLAAAALHWARVVCRRAERRCVSLWHAVGEDKENGMNPTVLPFLNRLSDLLFVLARVANQREGHADIPWIRRER